MFIFNRNSLFILSLAANLETTVPTQHWVLGDCKRGYVPALPTDKWQVSLIKVYIHRYLDSCTEMYVCTCSDMHMKLKWCMRHLQIWYSTPHLRMTQRVLNTILAFLPSSFLVYPCTIYNLFIFIGHTVNMNFLCSFLQYMLYVQGVPTISYLFLKESSTDKWRWLWK